ncbi:MAG: T9SS type A sorting domain-containing protein [Sporocytophaga sp.]|nr:T9SS type A sorting domain-containing protein [Sporocytophaga sp.]
MEKPATQVSEVKKSLTTMATTCTPKIGLTNFDGVFSTLTQLNQGTGSATGTAECFNFTSVTENPGHTARVSGTNISGNAIMLLQGIGTSPSANLKRVIIASNDGSEFSFKSIKVAALGAFGDWDIEYKGYRNGSAVPGATLTRSDLIASAWNTDNFSGVSAFNNVDEIRIEFTVVGSSYQNFRIDDIETGVAVPGSAAPTISTNSITTFDVTSATLGGNVIYENGATVTERGIVYNTTGTPTTSNNKVQIGNGIGSFSSNVNGLTAGTKYYVRAYAINSAGISYGDEKTFTTLVPNTAPSKSANTGASLNNGATHTITHSELKFTDSEQTNPADIKYIINALPAHGAIKVGGLNLTTGDKFSQQNINDGSVAYVHDGSPSISDNFQFDVTDGQGGTAANITFNFTISCALKASVIAQTSLACHGGNTGSVTVQATKGAANYSFVWNNGSTTNNTSSATNSITSLAAGTYSVTITDGNNCTATASTTLVQPANPVSADISSKTDVSCNGGSNGSATVSASGGTAPYFYSWSPTGGTAVKASGLSPGKYTVTVTDNNSCKTTADVTVAQPMVLSATITSKADVSCNGGSNGSATVSASGGTAPYFYSWSPTGGTAVKASGLSPGKYTVTVTDNNTCETTANVTVAQPTVLSASITSKTDVSCNGGSNGSATVSASGGTAPYFYSWSPTGGTAVIASGLSPGKYTVTVTDNNTCETTANVTVAQPTVLSASITSKTDVSCNGGSNGSATVSATGGTAPYFYSWSPTGGTAVKASGLSPGKYTVTVTDNNTCETTANVTVAQPTVLSASITSKTDVSCNGGSNGSATVSASGGTAPYFYSWSPTGGTAVKASGLSPGKYTVTVTDNNTCETTANVTVAQPTVLSASITSKTDVSCNGGSNGSATVSASGGTVPYFYSWSPAGGTAVKASGLTAGKYTVTVMDNNSCETTANVSVNEPETIKTSLQEEACGSYTWTNGKTYIESGIYIQTMKSKDGCDSIVELDLIIYPTIEVSLTNTDNVLSATGEGVDRFQWYNCDTKTIVAKSDIPTFTVNDIGMYAVIGTSVDGCTDTSDCIAIAPILGFNASKAMAEVKLFPNPASNRLEIHFPDNTATIEIYNASGTKVLQLNNFNSGNELFLEQFKTGIYQIKITTATNSWNKTVIKQ